MGLPKTLMDVDFVSVTITEQMLFIILLSTDVSCNGGSDGVAFVDSVSGGTAYFYTWSTGQNTSIINNLTLEHIRKCNRCEQLYVQPTTSSVTLMNLCFNI